MKKRASIILAGIAVAFGFLAIDVGQALAQTEKAKSESKPRGEWTFSAHPFMGKGYQTHPIVVTSVKSVANMLTVTEVRVRNTSTKPVSALKLGWTITRTTPNGPAPVSHGESALIPVTNLLDKGESTLLEVPLFSFVDETQDLAAKGKLKGEFSSQVFVSEIIYDDSSRWKVGDPPK